MPLVPPLMRAILPLSFAINDLLTLVGAPSSTAVASGGSQACGRCDMIKFNRTAVMYDAGLPCQPLPHFPARRVWNHRFSQLYSAGTRSFSGATAHCLLINSAYGGLIPLSWDAPQAAALIEGLPAEVVIADTAYDADHLRKDIAAKKALAVIPNNPSRALKYPLDKHLYAQRHLVECCFSKLKQFRRVATRFEKTARNYQAVVTLAAIVLWMR